MENTLNKRKSLEERTYVFKRGLNDKVVTIVNNGTIVEGIIKSVTCKSDLYKDGRVVTNEAYTIEYWYANHSQLCKGTFSSESLFDSKEEAALAFLKRQGIEL